MKTWKIRGFALTACFAFVTTARESKSDSVVDRRPTMTATLIEADGHDGAGNGDVPYGIGDVASETAYKSEARRSSRCGVSDNERPDRESDKKSESGKKDEFDKKRESEKKGKPEQKGKPHKKGESNKRESGKAGFGSSERSASRNYYFDGGSDEIVTPDGTFVSKGDPVTVVKTHNDVACVFSNGGIVRVEDGIRGIDVYGSDIDTVADSAVKVRILGFDVDVFTRSVSSVHFNGSDNDVRWTDGPIPSVTDNGAESEIRRIRPAPAC